MHNLLSDKQFGFRKNYSIDFHCTKTYNENSNLHKITCGIPQDSSLGPILFSLYINEIPSAAKFDITVFADDTYLSLADKNLSLLERRVNEKLYVYLTGGFVKTNC